MTPIFLGTFLTWNASDTEAVISYISSLISDLTPLLTPIIAVGLGLIVFSVIVGVIKK